MKKECYYSQNDSRFIRTDLEIELTSKLIRNRKLAQQDLQKLKGTKNMGRGFGRPKRKAGTKQQKEHQIERK